ncbi:patatin-like phospholipase family protein [Streptomyces sp. NBC_01764]|uniref:patatin-like phospholipase family protein n=1 Tax=Streptomyces sp. NBC_01764 TaxID=2975935 RepID=UPI00224F5876|nr:patatin-like phospholipase family protein [Streptomyces sp. NBC_01764]MCX4403074.1 patatin-like phospholipase family protein [Streptomyces sp. NBC_01764]
MTTTATPAAAREPEVPHPVWRVLTERAQAGSRPGARTDGHRVALAIEGGGMRGIIAGGMSLALHELGLTNGFDAVYGASAGAASGAWLLSSSPQSLRFWAEPRYARTVIRRSNPLRGRPLVDLHAFYEVLYRYGDRDRGFAPMDFASILASDIEYHPLATDAATGDSTDLGPFIGDAAELRLALRASAALPLLAGDPVMLGGRRFYDAGVSESVPYRTALAQGATHVMVLRSRREIDVARPSRSAPVIAKTFLRREPAALRKVFLDREARLAEDDACLAHHPAIVSIRPAPGTPQVGRLARQGDLLETALEAGRAAVHEAHSHLYDA